MQSCGAGSFPGETFQRPARWNTFTSSFLLLDEQLDGWAKAGRLHISEKRLQGVRCRSWLRSRLHVRGFPSCRSHAFSCIHYDDGPGGPVADALDAAICRSTKEAIRRTNSTTMS